MLPKTDLRALPCQGLWPAGTRGLSSPLVACVWLAALVGPGCSTADSSPPLVAAPTEVVTAHGPVRGTLDNGAIGYLGIPYAAAPVADLRFTAPEPPPSWSETLDANVRPRACPQVVPILGAQTNEDCLYVNVHVPPQVPETGAPVLFWIHGGGFTLGEGVQTDGGTVGDILAREEGIVVVSVNYRLGALGFLAHPALDDESPDGVSGNYGFLDQVAALRWVRENIRGFGGDPERITLAGQSAGGISVCAHLVSPLSQGLFHGAIVESGPCERQMTLEVGRTQGERFSAALPTPCDTGTLAEQRTCLRATSAADILATLPSSRDFLTVQENQAFWGPVIDGEVFPQMFGAAIRAGAIPDIPLLAGFTENEGRVFAALSEFSVAPTDYESELSALVGGPGAAADSVIAAYPLNGEDPTVRYFDAIGDQLLTCSARSTAVALGQARELYLYYYRYPDAAFQLPTDFDLGAYHAAEVQFLFGYRANAFIRRFNADETRMHEIVRSYWGSFVRDGVPSAPELPEWPNYNAAEDNHLELDLMVTTGTGAAAARCAVWDAL